MILVDFSSIIHRKIHTSISNAKPTLKDGKFVTSEFIQLTKYFILQELFDITKLYSSKYGDMIICLDDHTRQYWRKDVFPMYKQGRTGARDESNVDYPAVFAEINLLIEQLKHNIPWKVLLIQKAEADDTMLILADEYNKYEKIIIHSPDKDMIQAQRGNDTVDQYSSLTKKWLKPETKSNDMDSWIQEHCILGDAGDGVPRVVDHTEFTPTFLSHLKDNDLEHIKTPMDFRSLIVPDNFKKQILIDFDVYRINRKGESTGIKDVYIRPRFGPSTLQKKIKEFETVDNFLDSHPLYREHYNRNFTLVMQEGIPDYIRNNILTEYNDAIIDYNHKAFTDYLTNNNLNSIIMELPTVFKINRALTADDFGW